MKRWRLVAALIVLLIAPLGSIPGMGLPTAAAHGLLRCVAFSPYVQGYDPEWGPHPPRELIDELLDILLSQTDYRCIQVYGLLNGLDYSVEAAHPRGLKVSAIIWIDSNRATNDQSIDLGIEAAQRYPTTVLTLSCGSEVRTRHGGALDAEIRHCLSRLRAAHVTQPITTIDTWWEWCNRSWPCASSDLAPEVDWIGINVFPWWENKFSPLFPCTTAADAPRFHIERMQDVRATYPDKLVVLTEFGWPAGPDGYREVNRFTGQACGVASQANQELVIKETVRQLHRLGWPSVDFSAFREPWKTRTEGPVGEWWGRCEATPPYACGVTAVVSLSLNQTNFRPRDTLILTGTVTPGTVVLVDIYVAVQLPDRTLLFLQEDGSFTGEIRPIVRDWPVAAFAGEVFRYTFTGNEPEGTYTWLVAFTEPGTTNIYGNVTESPFTFTRLGAPNEFTPPFPIGRAFLPPSATGGDLGPPHFASTSGTHTSEEALEGRTWFDWAPNETMRLGPTRSVRR